MYPLLALILVWGGMTEVVGAQVGRGSHTPASKPPPRHPATSTPTPSAGSHSAPLVVLLPPYAVDASAARGTLASTPSRGMRHAALGLTLAASNKACVPSQAVRRSINSRHTLPLSVDLSRYDPPAADEGQIRAGAAWATAYTLLGWWANKDSLAIGPFAPMSVYAPLAHGKNRPITLADALALERRQGVDTQADYRQGRTDYRHGPTSAERAAAAQHRIAGYSCVYARHHSPFSAQTALKAVLAGGQPLVLGLPVYPNLIDASAAAPFVDLPVRGAKPLGAEAVVAVKYDSAGVWVENQWGPTWGLSGYAELSWRFVDADLSEAWTMSVNRPPAKRGLVASPNEPAAEGTAVAYGAYSTPVAPISATATAYASYPSYTSAPCPTSTPYSTDVTGSATYPADVTGSATYPADVTGSATYPADVTGVASAPTPMSTSVISATPVATVDTSCATSADAYATSAAGYPSSTDTGTGAYPYAYPTDTSSYASGTGAYPYAYPTDTGSSSYDYSTYSGYPTGTPTVTPTVTPTETSTATPIPPTETPQPKAQVADLPTSGAAGTTVYVAGTGFGSGSVAVYWDNSPAGLVFTDGSKFSLSITVPATATQGAATITCVNAQSGASASVPFTVAASASPPSPSPTATPTATMTVPPPTSTATVTATLTTTATPTVAATPPPMTPTP